MAVSDRNGATAGELARRFDARVYDDWRRLLDAENADFAFGRRCEMAAMGESLAARGISFVIEKPCGLNAAEVRGLKDQASLRKLFVGVPLVQQFGPLAQTLEAIKRRPSPRHAWFRFIAGPPSRCPAARCAPPHGTRWRRTA